jgi:hypothetical protein
MEAAKSSKIWCLITTLHVIITQNMEAGKSSKIWCLITTLHVIITQNMEAAKSSEIFVPYRITHYHNTEYGGSKILRDFGILPQHYTASKPRRPRLEICLMIVILLFKKPQPPKSETYAKVMQDPSGPVL